MKLTSVPIVFGIDQSYLKPMCVTISSILRHAGAVDENGIPREFYVFIDRIDPVREAIVTDLLKRMGASVVFIKLPVLGEDLGVNSHVSRHAFYRYFIPQILSTHYERAIYLDADIIVRGDIYSIFDHMKSTDGLGVYKENTPLATFQGDGRDKLPIPLENYFNSGVMAFNFENLPDGFLEKCQSHTKAEYPYRDQDALNVTVVKENIKVAYVPQTYNAFYSHPETHERSVAIHFISHVKPWKFDLDWAFHDLWRKERDYFDGLVDTHSPQIVRSLAIL